VAILEAGRHLLGEKPFGIDIDANKRIMAAVASHPELLVRCSSEMPFFPGGQAVTRWMAEGRAGRILEVRSQFLHSSDLDPNKPINWKRQAEFCGSAGVMNDLGMHVLHLPLRLGWRPRRLYAVLQDIVHERPGPDGEPVACDTWDNATIHADAGFPLTLATKRIAPREMNTWRLKALGMDGGIEFSTASPKVVKRFAVRDGRQLWEHIEIGSQSAFASTAGGIWEFGFSDAILQMWAAFLAEREGALGDRLGCVTPQEALTAHEIFHAAQESGASCSVVALGAR
jgi:predicted dehydrogenase